MSTTAERTRPFRQQTRAVGVPRAILEAYERPAPITPVTIYIIRFGPDQGLGMSKKFWRIRDALQFRNICLECDWQAQMISTEEVPI